MGQAAAAVVVILSFVSAYVIWTGWSRASLVFAGTLLAFAALLIVRWPIIGTCAAGFIIFSNTTAVIPSSISGALVVTLAAALYGQVSLGKLNFPLVPLLPIALLFFSWYTASALWAPTYDYFTFGVLYRPVLIVIVLCLTVRRPEHFVAVVLAAGLGTLVSFYFTIDTALEFMTGGSAAKLAQAGSEVNKTRFFGNWPEPNQMALSMAPIVGLCLALVRSRITRWLRYGALLVVIAGSALILLSLSRGGIIALLVALAVTTTFLKNRTRFVILASGFFTLTMTVLPVDVLARIGTFGEGTGDSSLNSRLMLVEAGLDLAARTFPFGAGLGGFRWRSSDLAEFEVHTIISHNTFIDVLSETGIVGIILFSLVIMAVILRIRVPRSLRGDTSLYACTKVGCAAACWSVLWSFTNLTAASFQPFWFVLALAFLHAHIFSRGTLRPAFDPAVVPVSIGVTKP